MRLAFLAILLSLGLVVAAVAYGGRQAAVCHVSTLYGLPGPDDADGCTPGDFDPLAPYTRADGTTVTTKEQVCDGSDRPTLRAADKREVLGEYGETHWTKEDGEIDHRQPLFLGGLTTPDNLWPEPGGIPNAKDRVEFRAYRMVCFADPFSITVRYARRLFTSDWRLAYETWKAEGIL